MSGCSAGLLIMVGGGAEPSAPNLNSVQANCTSGDGLSCQRVSRVQLECWAAERQVVIKPYRVRGRTSLRAIPGSICRKHPLLATTPSRASRLVGR
jgi:hypothetical protein